MNGYLGRIAVSPGSWMPLPQILNFQKASGTPCPSSGVDVLGPINIDGEPGKALQFAATGQALDIGI